MKKWILCLFLLISCYAAEKKICLNMIVKDEAEIIVRCLKSVKPFIDYWIIVDTGSTDGTQEKICEFMKDVPGELHERAWVNFGYNRNEALQLAKNKGDYLLFIDADEELEGGFNKNQLGLDYYMVNIRLSKEPYMTIMRPLLVGTHLRWVWRGVIHEALNLEDERTFAILPDAMLSEEARDGCRTKDPDKYAKDALVLEKALKDEPYNSEYAFYLGQSYHGAQDLQKALKAYQRRAEMGGWPQHTYWAKYATAKVQQELGMKPELFLKNYSAAFAFRPIRAEPLAQMAHYFYNQENYLLSYLITQFALNIPTPDDTVYLERWVYSHGLLALFANSAMRVGRNQEAKKAYQKLTEKPGTPADMRAQAEDAVKFLETIE